MQYKVLVDGFELYNKRFDTKEEAEEQAAVERRWSSVSNAWVEEIEE